MTVHYFHATNGRDVVLDRRGRRIGDPDRVAAEALAQARRLMAALPGYEGWGAWTMLVHNHLGDWVETVPFPAERGAGAGRGEKAAPPPGVKRARPALACTP